VAETLPEPFFDVVTNECSLPPLLADLLNVPDSC
jgi:hypothetical protein